MVQTYNWTCPTGCGCWQPGTICRAGMQQGLSSVEDCKWVRRRGRGPWRQLLRGPRAGWLQRGNQWVNYGKRDQNWQPHVAENTGWHFSEKNLPFFFLNFCALDRVLFIMFENGHMNIWTLVDSTLGRVMPQSNATLWIMEYFHSSNYTLSK